MNAAQRAELFEMRRLLDKFIDGVKDSPEAVNDGVAAVRPWTPGAFSAGDVRRHAGIPYRCVSAHDSTGNPGWSPDVTTALWMQYHGTSKATARPWVRPSGSHDMYRAGEWAVLEGMAYPCLSDTVYSPSEYPEAWGTPEPIE